MIEKPPYIWSFEPKYHRLATLLPYRGVIAEYAERYLNTEIIFLGDLSPKPDCLWIFFPQDFNISRFWRSEEAAATVADEYSDLIIFYAELIPPKED